MASASVQTSLLAPLLGKDPPLLLFFFLVSLFLSRRVCVGGQRCVLAVYDAGFSFFAACFFKVDAAFNLLMISWYLELSKEFSPRRAASIRCGCSFSSSLNLLFNWVSFSIGVKQVCMVRDSITFKWWFELPAFVICSGKGVPLW